MDLQNHCPSPEALLGRLRAFSRPGPGWPSRISFVFIVLLTAFYFSVPLLDSFLAQTTLWILGTVGLSVDHAVLLSFAMDPFHGSPEAIHQPKVLYLPEQHSSPSLVALLTFSLRSKPKPRRLSVKPTSARRFEKVSLTPPPTHSIHGPRHGAETSRLLSIFLIRCVVSASRVTIRKFHSVFCPSFVSCFGGAFLPSLEDDVYLNSFFRFLSKRSRSEGHPRSSFGFLCWHSKDPFFFLFFSPSFLARYE